MLAYVIHFTIGAKKLPPALGERRQGLGHRLGFEVGSAQHYEATVTEAVRAEPQRYRSARVGGTPEGPRTRLEVSV